MKKHIFLLFIILFILINTNCKENKNKFIFQNFKDFFEVFKKAVKEKNIKTIDQLASEDFSYATNDEKENYSREEAIQNFDFDLVEKLISEGYTEDIPNKNAFCPPLGKMKKYGYAIDFINEGKGWKILSIYTGPIGEVSN